MSVQRARRLRKTATDAKKRLWSRLRNRQVANLKFRRQHPLSNRIVDFFVQRPNLELNWTGQTLAAFTAFIKHQAKGLLDPQFVCEQLIG